MRVRGLVVDGRVLDLGRRSWEDAEICEGGGWVRVRAGGCEEEREGVCVPEEPSDKDTELDLARAIGTSILVVAEDFGLDSGLSWAMESPRTREEKAGSATVMALECLCCAWCSSV